MTTRTGARVRAGRSSYRSGSSPSQLRCPTGIFFGQVLRHTRSPLRTLACGAAVWGSSCDTASALTVHVQSRSPMSTSPTGVRVWTTWRPSRCWATSLASRRTVRCSLAVAGAISRAGVVVSRVLGSAVPSELRAGGEVRPEGLLHGRGQAGPGGHGGRCAGVHHRSAHRREEPAGPAAGATVGDGIHGGGSLRTVWRRLSTIAGLCAFRTARGDVPGNPVPGVCRPPGTAPPAQGVPLVRAPRTLPRILAPAEVDALTAALRSHRDRAMVAAMVLGGLRRCEVLGLRLDDVRAAQRRLFIPSGKGGHQRAEVVASRAKAAGSAR